MSVASDLRHGVRLLARSPIFTLTSILSLAIGIAATTAIFSIADAMFLRPRVGVRHPATLVDIGRTTQGEGFDNFGYPLFAAMREQTKSFEGVSATRGVAEVMALGNAESSERVFAALVSGNYFEVVGTRAALGRFFTPEEDRIPGARPVAVLTHHFWTRRFSADPNIIGQTIRLNNLPYTIVGVAEEGFTGTTIFSTDLWVPMAMDAQVRASDTSLLTHHDAVWMMALGRLKNGVTPQQARDELAAIMRNYLREQGQTNRVERWGVGVAVSSRVPPGFMGPVAGFIGVLGALTALVLLIACSNVAAMLLARALDRRREVATRLAIGASRGRILAQLLTEGLTLALLAGTLSIPLAAVIVAWLSSLQPSLPVALGFELRVDPRVMAFAFLISGLTCIAFALLPALQTTRVDVAPALHGRGTTADRKRAWLRQGLVAGQVAMALLLLIAAGLFLRSLQEAASVDIGFNPRGVDTLQIDTRIGGYRTDADGMRAVDSLSDELRRVPGVVAVAASRMVPLQGGGLGLGRLRVPGRVGPDGTDEISADWDVISERFFETLEMPIVQGRAFNQRDRAGAPYVAIINETMAAELWPGQNPIGRTILQQVSGTEERALHVVGVARQSKYRTVGETPLNFIYVPIAQQFMSEVTFYVRRGTGASLISELRSAVVRFNPNLPVIFAQTLESATAVGLLPQRLAAWIAGSVGTIGLLLAALGLYGLTAFSVAQRAREIAVRMALGATRQSVLSLVLRQAGRLAAIGTVVGLALAAGISQLLGSLLVGVGAIDLVAFGVATALMVAVLLLASWAPARRASAMDPMGALRAE